MKTSVTLSSRDAVTLPRDIHAALGLRPGQHLKVSVDGARIVLTPVVSMAELEGVLRGRKLDFEREPDRDLG